MEISQVTSGASVASPSATQAESAVLSSDFEMFLTMLTAQAQYQDPLEPIDSSEYAAQLAQFSMVEQQVLTNDLLTAMSQSTGEFGETATWIGRSARTSSPVAYAGQQITLNLHTAPGATESHLVVRNGSGHVVQRLAVSTQGGDFAWPPTGGQPALPHGTYSFAVENAAQGEALGDTAVDTYREVTEISLQKGAVHVLLSDGTSVAASQVTALRL